VAIKIDIAVIGAGQAGLSAAYHLRRLGLEADKGFVIFDRSPGPGGAWQFRWRSLALASANRIHDLPGLKLDEAIVVGENGEVQASRAVPEYYDAHEKAFDLRVHRPVIITVVGDSGERLRVETDAALFSARGIVNAAGTWETPYIELPRNSQANKSLSLALAFPRCNCSTRLRVSLRRRGSRAVSLNVGRVRSR
jgi:cation diffusion facilitator CzcD-associated flavoprotein CzcO